MNSRLPLLLVGVAALSSAADAQPQGRFDLACVGKQTGTRGTEDFKQVLHVDLKRRIYCWDTCTIWLPIRKIEANRITFRDKSAKHPWAKDLAWWEIRSGKYEGHVMFSARAFIEIKTEAVCRMARFSADTKS